jgi:hypothetical protein
MTANAETKFALSVLSPVKQELLPAIHILVMIPMGCLLAGYLASSSLSHFGTRI